MGDKCKILWSMEFIDCKNFVVVCMKNVPIDFGI